MSKRLDRLLRDVGVIYAGALADEDKAAVAETMSAATVADALAVVAKFHEARLFTTARAEQLRSRLRETGPTSKAYRDRVRTVGERCLSLQDPIVAEAHLVRAQLATDDALKIRRAVLRLGGRRPGLRFRFAKWLTDLDNKMQDLDRKLRVHEDEKKEPSADVSAKRNKTNSKEGLFVFLMAITMLGSLGWYINYQLARKNEVIAAEEIMLQSGKIVPAGAKGTRSDTPCKLIDRTAGVSVLFERDRNTPVETCVRESMITR